MITDITKKKNFICHFCNSSNPIISDTYTVYYSSFNFSNSTKNLPKSITNRSNVDEYFPTQIAIEFYKCSSCGKTSIKITTLGSQFKNKYSKWFYPKSKAKQFPDFVPQSIREDYEEAYAILEDSPKASATLSRRCLQTMINDCFKVSSNILFHQIDEIKDKIDPDLYNAIDSLRKIGNIGAHMTKDVNLIIDIEPSEAEKLISLIEWIIKERYIIPHEREELFSEIVEISCQKQSMKKSNS